MGPASILQHAAPHTCKLQQDDLSIENALAMIPFG